MKTKRIICVSLTFLIIFGASFCILSSLTDNLNTGQKIIDKKLNEIQTPDNKEPKVSNGNYLDYSHISRNATVIRKVFESINITIDASGFDKANYTIMTLSFGENLDFDENNYINITMVNISIPNKIFETIFRPNYTIPVGFVRVYFWIYNYSKVLLNTFRPAGDTNFTILPNCALNPSLQQEYYLGNQIESVLVFNNLSIITWEISIVDNINKSKANVIFIYGNNEINVNFTIDERFSQENKDYYIKVNITEKGRKLWDVEYFNFIVKVPESILEINTIHFNPTSVFRTQLCTLTLNVSAKDNSLIPMYVNVTLTLKDTNFNTIINNINLANDNNDESFSTTFSAPSNGPAGSYSYTIKTYYKLNQIEEYTSTILIKNNPPKIAGYDINDYGTEKHISVRYGETLEFEFDVSDVEDRLSYVTVKLINEEGDEYEISRKYDDDLIIEVRTEELITGTWIVYVSVTDLDGETTELDDDFDEAPKEIEIIPDTLTSLLPWILLIIGIIVGIVSGIGISYYLVKKQKLKFEPEELKEVSKAKPLKTKKEKTVKPESTEKELEKEEFKKAEQKKEEFGKEEPRKIRPPRKIKRKLK